MPGLSRRERFDWASGEIQKAKDEIDTLLEELQNWLDNMPENLQSSERAEKLQDAIDELEECSESLQEALDHQPEFPSMYG